ncbi:hypothetical protein MPTK1_5g06150 [Marchantia polymorpha subsp. ruderalis]|uniref:F-box domain-containing protein n=2 Tax=Marchantia polymorpha TaxID=3197 RepID=A0AAF6BFG9_MARPO|nr:hypothetical protein MARPO_0027s0014 [Marchantia polymorpha]BBN10753.1 hypothetical protein Mp_5g06150 [Marchantia polymorpha subsp. ruderalis]|eukprot:PTQ42880.1 hypothetical protein MARPO_0027s0014 [Marchantia polymorpha]
MAPTRLAVAREAGPLNNDIVYEVLRRVDPVTLATASCVSSGIKSMTEDEAMWEKCCNERWPSTKDPEVKAILSEVGGFRKLYAECYPLILNRQQPMVRDEDEYGMKDCDAWWDDEDDLESHEPSDLSPSNLISIVDVVYNGKSVFSRTVQGIPGADDFLGWFSNCPFRIDLLKSPEEEDERGHEAQAPVLVTDGLPSITSVEKERKDGKFWKALWDNMRVSWILINKKTKQMANLASWRPLGGLRHWPCDEDFLIRFGSILPANRDSLCSAVQCNIVMKCRFSNLDVGETVNTTLRLTELSMQLEDMGGAHVNGKDSLAILHKALNCPKSRAHVEVLNSYHQYLKVQSELKEKKIRHEGRLDTAAVVSGIGVFVFICYFII